MAGGKRQGGMNRGCGEVAVARKGGVGQVNG